MNTAEILKKVRQIEIRTGKLVTETFAGEYQSVFKGRGMEFAEVREYVPGDDVRSIDWNVTARFSRPFVKRFVEERELTLMVLCDISGSQAFGTRARTKGEASAELSAMFALSALRNNDKTGLLLFTDRDELYIPPRKGKNHILRIIREVLAREPQGSGTSIARALETCLRLMKRKGIIIVVSDFQDSGYARPLRLAAKRHDVIPVLVGDPAEAALPEIRAVLRARGLEDGEFFSLDLASRRDREAWAAARAAFAEEARKTFRSAGLDWIETSTDGDIAADVVKFFRAREKKIKL